MNASVNALEDQGGFSTAFVGDDENSTPQRLCRHDENEERVSWPIDSIVHTVDDFFCYRVRGFVGEEGVLAKHLKDTADVDVIEHRSGWVYFRGEISQRSRKELLDIEGVRVFDDDIIIESIHVEDELDADVDHTIHVVELGDWVTPDLGAYKGDVGCIVATHDWGYDVAFIPRYISSIADDYAQAPLVVATHDEAHTFSGPGLAGAKPLIEDGLQILELSAKSVTIAGNIPVHILQMFASPCAHVDTNKSNSLQALVSRSLWKCPRPQEWIFSVGEEVMVQSSVQGRVIESFHAGLDVYCSYHGKVRRYGWMDIYKTFRVGEFVKILSGDNQGKLGCVQCIDDAVALDILVWPDNTREINVWRNSVASTNSPKAFAALAPDKITDRMYTGETPWQDVNVIVLPSNDRSVTTAHAYKGQVGTVLDVLLKQLRPSGIRVCVRLSRTYRAAGGFAKVWLDYDEVVEESTGLPLWYCLPLRGDQIAFMPSREYRRMGNEQKNVEQKSPPPPRSVTPPYAGSNEDSGTGNAWDPSAPEPITRHWCQHPALAQRVLHVNMLGKTQPQNVRMEFTGSGCKIMHLFRTVAEEVLTPWRIIKPVEPNVRDFHRWVIIQGPGLGKLVRGIRYVEGSKPTKWWVREVSKRSGEVDEFVGEPLEVVSSDMCVAADGDEDYRKNLSWAQSQRESPVRAPKRRRKDVPR
ncbi:hypothetical protein EDD18DRAFT_1355404 [Armillaria luteobubalina]|uniref:KOW domain-containing protein n=1 Tax=Armillaria luteobubalina TaxID=153913 RepID=A0AA39Q1T1_9AGAR|nr:hypothetical protein EDD18DRAFT_1355404 [Armillaria luteobubalina]